MRPRQKKIQVINQAISRCLIVFFVLQLCVSLFNKAHNIIHHHGYAELHSKQHELDPCHRSIYHHDQKNHCHHEGHLEKPSYKCSICIEFFISKDLEIQINWHRSSLDFIQTSFCALASELNDKQTDPSSRGPPTQVL